MIKYRIIQYKRSTFPLGLQARNVNKSEKNHNNGSYTTKKKQRGDDKRKGKKIKEIR